MAIGMYSIFDKQLKSYMDTFQAPADAVAVRSFGDLVRAADPKVPVCAHPEDFHLSRVGSWDPSTGQLVGEEPTKLIDALSLVQDEAPRPSNAAPFPSPNRAARRAR